MRQEAFQFLIPPTFRPKAEAARLSPREIELMERFAMGESYKIAADALGVTEKTVDAYSQKIRLKLGFETTNQCVIFLLQ
jgi:DNA-binding NarL/FixJ family response regulator